MVSSEERAFISKQFTENKYCRKETELQAKCIDSSFSFITSKDKENSNSCGDYVSFAAKRNKEGFEELLFYREESCIITVASTNILCDWIAKKRRKFAETKELLLNIRKMVEGENYNLTECKEIEVFSNLKSFALRKGCLLLVVDSLLPLTEE